MNNDVKCECGARVPLKRMKVHRTTISHRCELSAAEANRRGHIHIIAGVAMHTVEQLIAAGYKRHFSTVFVQRRGGVVGEHVCASTRMMEMLHRFASVQDDMPEGTMHAALVFAEVYGAEAPRILLSVMESELGEEARRFEIALAGRMGSTYIPAENESSLIAVLRANGVHSPARALANLSPHLLRACAEVL